MPKKNYGEPIPCMLELSPGSGEKCRPGECKSCGWNHKVHTQRMNEIRMQGLTKCRDGKRRLIVRKEKGDGQESVCGRDEQGSD